MTKISDTELDVFPLCLGGNVFGWTADEDASFAVLDAYVAAGGNFIDTADLYAGGESEKIIGRWLARRGRRDDIVIATKVGMAGERANLKPETIRAAAEDSLRSLGVDHIDLYYAHRDDLGTPIEETLSAFDELVREGKVRHIAASNYEAPRLAAALKISETEGLARYVALQPHYNLMERGFEEELADLCARENLGVLPYFGLARGFLTGKYRPGGPEGDSPRAERAREYLNERRGVAVLGALDEIAAAHDTSLGAVALAWLLAQPTVVAPIASARNTEQLAGLLPIADLTLSADELERLSSASV
ncbi:aldo/keto reductase [Actinoallomurus iriomotensis]|uniref:NADP-dependent aryl-alcohol dehydrogenase n=1 Tax=Actinoallomurus iriomotensis TaxID=478107 RepID=A0A9W6SDF9_9ACTN|nr:aldo/keto reductase [Actinoallomurus iriomotensis]GLY91576.1 NADP-dependent aryl-alcohol dehydrogenase [Actinoallomurus iriomotensis]